MKENTSTREIIERMVKQSGITKKLSAEILHAIPGIIEEGLEKDGEVRVKGLGTFRLKWTRGRMGRNPKTGERVEIPSHNRVVFLPEQALKDYINRDYRLLGYKIIPPAGQVPVINETLPEPEIIEQYHPLPEPESIPEIESESESEPGPEPKLSFRKRRTHWIVPVAISVILILSLVFYLRNCYQVGDKQVKAPGQKTEVDSRQLTVDSSQQSTVSGQKESEPTQNSKLKTVPEGTRLFKLAREIFGNPYLWVLIYKENQDKISDPDVLISGRELVIPVLEGAPERLTRNDSMAVSEGYRLVYEYFKTKDDPRANDFFKAMKRYKPK